MGKGVREGLERDEEDLLERSIKKPKENGFDDAPMDEEMKEDSLSDKKEPEPRPVGLKQSISEGVSSPNGKRNLVSYKDIVLQLNGDGDDEDSEDEHWMSIQRREEEEDGMEEEEIPTIQSDPLCPVYHFSASQYKEDCKKWKKALIIKLIGKRINNRFLMTRLLKVWGLVGKFEIIDLENGFILINLHDDKDYNHVLHDGPWIVVDHYVSVQNGGQCLTRLMRTSGEWLCG